MGGFIHGGTIRKNSFGWVMGMFVCVWPGAVGKSCQLGGDKVVARCSRPLLHVSARNFAVGCANKIRLVDATRKYSCGRVMGTVICVWPGHVGTSCQLGGDNVVACWSRPPLHVRTMALETTCIVKNGPLLALANWIE